VRSRQLLGLELLAHFTLDKISFVKRIQIGLYID
jgi:hypothetical protein